MKMNKYQYFLDNKNILPKMVVNSLSYLGLKEVVGKGSNPMIMKMAKELGVDKIYKDDDTAWCALYHAYICKISGKPMRFKGYDLLRAKSFTEWGNAVRLKDAKLGDTIIFTRPQGFHVGLYIGESKETYHILGGNQRNSVSITEIAKSQAIAVRNFYKIGPPNSVKKYIIGTDGTVEVSLS